MQRQDDLVIICLLTATLHRIFIQNEAVLAPALFLNSLYTNAMDSEEMQALIFNYNYHCSFSKIIERSFII